MKPWPDAIKACYSFGEDAHPSRPWWRWTTLKQQGGEYASYGWLRTDGQQIGVDDRNPTSGRNRYPEAVERTDREHPLPRPPLRALQVWADERGCTTTLLTVHGDSARCVDFIRLSENTGTVGIVYFNPSAYPYLVADPSRPSAAPWSPAEGVP